MVPNHAFCQIELHPGMIAGTRIELVFVVYETTETTTPPSPQIAEARIELAFKVYETFETAMPPLCFISIPSRNRTCISRFVVYCFFH